MSVLSIENLSYAYPNAETPALNDVSLSVNKGEFVVICGPTGAGKTTFCRCILGLIPHFFGGDMSGKVVVLDTDTRDIQPSRLAAKVGLVFQNPEDQLIAMSVEEELAFGLENLGLPREEIKKRIDETLNLVNIKELRDRSPSELSSGQQQKVAIAAVLAMNPEILVLDEPTSMIDPKSALDITQFLNKLNKERGVTVIVAEHRLENLVSFADKIVVINNGSIVQAGSPREIFASNNLLDIGVAIPRIIQLANRLKKAGIKIDNLPLTVEEEFSVLRRIL
jgi:energy-coupling factor transporter ATPase